MKPFVALAPVLLVALGSPSHAVPPPPLPAMALPPKIVDGTCKVMEDAWYFDCRPLDESDYCKVTLTQTALGECVIDLDPTQPATLDGKVMQPTVGKGRLFVIPAGRHELVQKSEIRIEPHVPRNAYVADAVYARHIWLFSADLDTTYTFGIEPSPFAARAEGYRATLDVVPPEELEWRGTVLIDPKRNTPWEKTAAGLKTVYTPLGTDTAETSPRTAGLGVFGHDASLFQHGGPQLSLGASLLDKTESFRVRAEYEFGIDGYILPGIAIDADTEMGFLVVPRVEVASPMVVIIPSFSVGLGLPIELSGDPDIGIRFLGGLQFGPVGFVANYDLFPGKGRADETSLLLRVSL